MDDQEVESKKFKKGFDLMPLSQAFSRFPGMEKEYLWKLVKKDKDEYTRRAADAAPVGYFIRVPKGHEAVLPLQACFFIRLTELCRIEVTDLHTGNELRFAA